jgi:hypothetical protein
MSRTPVTVKSLIAAARRNGSIELPRAALITPAARDWLQSCALPVRYAEVADAPAAQVQAAPLLYLVGDAADPTCRVLWPLLERTLGPVELLSCGGHREGLLGAVARMCEAVAQCPRRRGAMVVHEAALAACVANKRPGIRAAVVRRSSELTVLMNALGLNVLVLEHGVVSMRQMASLIATVARGEGSTDPMIAAALENHEADASASAVCGCSHADR